MRISSNLRSSTVSFPSNHVTVKYSLLNCKFYGWRSIGMSDRRLGMNRVLGARRSAAQHTPACKFDHAPHALYAIGLEN